MPNADVDADVYVSYLLPMLTICEFECVEECR